MRNLCLTLAQGPRPELFFQAWIATTILLAAYIIGVSTVTDEISTSLWLIGAPIALLKAALILSGLGFLAWFVLSRPTHRD